MSVSKEFKIKAKISKLENQLRFVKSRKTQRQLAIAITRLEGQLEKLQSRPANGFIFSKPVVAKALGVSVQTIEKVIADGEDAIAILTSGKRKKVTLWAAKVALGNLRRLRAEKIKISQDKRNPSSTYQAVNPENGHAHTLYLMPKYIGCNCKDYQELVKNLGSNQVACKHIYALLGHIGYSSLNEYVKAQEAFNKFEKESEVELEEREYREAVHSINPY